MKDPDYLGQFNSPTWGKVSIHRGVYASNKALSVSLIVTSKEGWREPLAILSVNMDHGQDGLQSHELPPDHFYAKTWSENGELARECLATGIFEVAADFPPIQSGFVTAPVWRIRKAQP